MSDMNQGFGVPSGLEAIEIIIISADQQGGRQTKLLKKGCTFREFLNKHFESKDDSPESYTVRVNRQAVGDGYVMQHGDILSISAVKLEGAVAV